MKYPPGVVFSTNRIPNISLNHGYTHKNLQIEFVNFPNVPMSKQNPKPQLLKVE